MTRLTQPVSNVMYRTLQRWGEISDDDHVWRAHAFDVADPAAFVSALDTFLNSKTGKEFPGQVFLSAVVAGGISPVTHVISVGQKSEAAIEAWEGAGRPDAAYRRFLAAERVMEKLRRGITTEESRLSFAADKVDDGRGEPRRV